eukprot:scaffold39174_cov30-Attheya_sp.AAC.1
MGLEPQEGDGLIKSSLKHFRKIVQKKWRCSDKVRGKIRERERAGEKYPGERRGISQRQREAEKNENKTH